MCKNLGEIISKFAILQADEALCHEDVSAWNAPSECHNDVSISSDRAWLSLEDKLSLPFSQLKLEAISRTSESNFHRAFNDCVSRIIARNSIFRN